jgi:hypothetical protein
MSLSEIKKLEEGLLKRINDMTTKNSANASPLKAIPKQKLSLKAESFS